MSATTGVLLHTATISHHREARGGLRTAHAICTTCDWEGPTRLTADAAWADGADHEDGIEAAA